MPDGFCALFQETDRITRATRSPESDSTQIVYEATRDVVLARFSLLGYTAQIARECISKWIANKKATMEEDVSRGDAWARHVAKVLPQLSVDAWYARIPSVLEMFSGKNKPSDTLGWYLLHDMEEWSWFDGYGSMAGLRALLDACLHAEKVSLDVTHLVNGERGRLCEDRRKENMLKTNPFAPAVILAEGRTDIELLKRSLFRMFPERRDYFSFFEHAELKVDGGTAYLVKFLKAFAAARAPIRIVAIFDNDTAGLQAYRQASDLNLKGNMILLPLPDIELAKSYPTIGPQGSHIVDVNGKAASIELYLGRTALSVDGELRPVRWTGYNEIANSYQGAVEGKNRVCQQFLRELDSFSQASDARSAFPELVSVWEAIFDGVKRSAETAENRVVSMIWS